MYIMTKRACSSRTRTQLEPISNLSNFVKNLGSTRARLLYSLTSLRARGLLSLSSSTSPPFPARFVFGVSFSADQIRSMIFCSTCTAQPSPASPLTPRVAWRARCCAGGTAELGVRPPSLPPYIAIGSSTPPPVCPAMAAPPSHRAPYPSGGIAAGASASASPSRSV